MNKNSKKLVVFVIIALITMLSAVAVASADGNKFKPLHGKYAGNTVGTCIVTAVNGVNPDFTVKDMNQTGFYSYNEQTIWTFKADGTATVEGMRIQINYSDPMAIGNLTSVNFSYDIKYDLRHDGTITTELIPETFEGITIQPVPGLPFNFAPISDSGMVSQDYKTIILGTEKLEVAITNIPTPTGPIPLNNMLCAGGRVLIRVGD